MLVRLVILLAVCVERTSPLLSIALHAQVAPNDGLHGVVGSVITTDGLRSALLKRSDVGNVEVFYSASYRDFLDSRWDFILIEGWFPSLDQFVSLVRNRIDGVKIIFYCLDPSYPGISIISRFDVDGILTNSRQLLNDDDLNVWTIGRRMSYMMLAANPDKMKPNNTIERKWGAVYVGAGGNMLEYKPMLYHLLLDTLPFGLRLHGSSWEHVPVLKDVWMGPLPTNDISNAYGSALVVLASTIQSQESYGMINNRIFEALSCGAIVVMSNFCPSIHREFGDIIMYINETHPFKRIFDYIQFNELQANLIRGAGRAEILKKHTWEHRVIELLDFYNQLPPSSDYSHKDFIRRSSDIDRLGFVSIKSCFRPNCRNVIVIVSTQLCNHSDVVLVILPGIHRRLSRDYNLQFLSELEFEENSIESADMIIAVVTPFDTLDCFVQALPPTVAKLQKRAAYLIGFDALLLSKALRRSSTLKLPVNYNYYDLVFFRDAFEMGLWRAAGLSFTAMRLQHAFGIGKLEVSEKSGHERSESILFVCFWTFRQLCTVSERNNLLGNGSDKDSAVLLLLGGEWSGWVDMDGVLEVNMLHNVVHVGDGRVGDAVQRVQSADRVFIMHDSTAAAAAATTADVLWPFVAAAVAGVRIHFSRRIDHFLSLMNIQNDDAIMVRMTMSIQDWDGEKYLQNMLREGVDKLQGLGSASSAVSASEVEFSDPIISSRMSTQEMDYLHILSRSKHILKLFLLDVDNFHIGREGQCCVSIRNSLDQVASMVNDSRAADNDSICMLRPFRYLVLATADKIDINQTSSTEGGCALSKECMRESTSTMTLKLSLRGNFYSDVFFSTNLSFRLLSPSSQYSMEWLSQPPSHELNYSEIGLLSNIFFVHTLNLT